MLLRFLLLFFPSAPRLVCVCVVSQGNDAMYWAGEKGFGPEVEVRHTAVVMMLLS